MVEVGYVSYTVSADRLARVGADFDAEAIDDAILAQLNAAVAPFVVVHRDGKVFADEDAADDALFFFNNCVGIQATANARRLAEVLKKVAPDVRVVEPPPPRQRDLFGDA